MQNPVDGSGVRHSPAGQDGNLLPAGTLRASGLQRNPASRPLQAPLLFLGRSPRAPHFPPLRASHFVPRPRGRPLPPVPAVPSRALWLRGVPPAPHTLPRIFHGGSPG